jgi:hypothetical protein
MVTEQNDKMVETNSYSLYKNSQFEYCQRLSHGLYNVESTCIISDHSHGLYLPSHELYEHSHGLYSHSHGLYKHLKNL